MKQILKFLSAAVLLVPFAACDEEYTTYEGPEYVMFVDSLSVNLVQRDETSFAVPVCSTVACDYDRTFGVEVVPQGSNAIEGLHYTLASHTVTIKAGERAADVLVQGRYDRFEATDSLGFVLQLVMPEQLEWPLYASGNRTKVVMRKCCPFDINDFTGWCVVTSTMLLNYPSIGTNSYQRLIRTERHPSDPDAIVAHDWLYDGYDVVIGFDASDPADPRVLMADDQVLSDEESVFGQIHGDNKILAGRSPLYTSYFNSCQHFVSLWIRVYVNDLATAVGSVGNFYNIMEWVSDEEADRLRREEGM